MTIPITIRAAHINIEQADIMIGGPCVALLADLAKAITIGPMEHARIPTPIAYVGDGKTIGLIDMRAGRLRHHVEGADEDPVIAAHGEYFLPSPGEEAVVTVEVVNETGATLIINPGVQLGVMTFVTIGGEEQQSDTTEPEQATMEMDFHPLHLSDSRQPNYGANGGIPLRADVGYDIKVPAHGSVVIPTGLSIKTPAGHEAQLRSSTRLSMNLSVQNRAVDTTGTDVINVVLVNNADEIVTIKQGDEIADLLIVPVSRPTLVYPGHEAIASSTVQTAI